MPALQLSDAVARIKPSATIAAATKAAELKAQGVSVLSFTLGEPDFDTPAHICEAATQAMAEGHTHYTPAGGTVELKEAICRAYARDYGLEYTPANVVCSNGAKHSIHNVLAALCGPGDEVVIPTPYWVSYADLVELTGAKAVLVETTEASGWVLAPEQLREAVTPATKLVMLNSPTNPTGAVYPVETLKALGEVIVEKDLWCLTDEIYEKLIYPGYEFAPFAGFGDEVKARTIVVSGVSKAYAMTGWRMGWAISPDPALAKAMTKLQSQETSCPSSVTQKATIAALDGPQDCVAEMLSAFTARRTFVLEKLAGLPDVTYAEPGGAFYAFFNVAAHFGKPLGSSGRSVENATDFCTQLLEDAQIALVTGDAFGAPGYVRMSYATDLETLGAGFEKLGAFFARE